MVGAETVRQDNPRLTVRLPEYKGKRPLRVVFSKSGHLPKDAHLFSDGLETIIYSPQKIPHLPSIQVQNLKEAMQDLWEKNTSPSCLRAGQL